MSSNHMLLFDGLTQNHWYATVHTSHTGRVACARLYICVSQ